MVACPFEIPAYEYHDPITPRVMKCTFCYERVRKEGKLPGCARSARWKPSPSASAATCFRGQAADKENPGRYLDHVYGEKEVGGTSWMYLSGVPFEARLQPAENFRTPMPQLAETIQHALFSYLWSPIALFGMLAA
jgi:formate dehydrogenase iron-sulfur subunit